MCHTRYILYSRRCNRHVSQLRIPIWHCTNLSSILAIHLCLHILELLLAPVFRENRQSRPLPNFPRHRSVGPAEVQSGGISLDMGAPTWQKVTTGAGRRPALLLRLPVRQRRLPPMPGHDHVAGDAGRRA
jgi:hypothetical protein